LVCGAVFKGGDVLLERARLHPSPVISWRARELEIDASTRLSPEKTIGRSCHEWTASPNRGFIERLIDADAG
jgi:hypothetical protein